MSRQTKNNSERKSYLHVPFERKNVDEKGAITGYGSVFGNVDHGKDVVASGAFKKSLSAHERAGTLPSMFYNHLIHEPVGDWLKMGEDSKGLVSEGLLWIGKGIPKAEQAYMLAKGNSPKGLSIGYIPNPSKIDFDSKTGVRTIGEVELLEVSIVAFPMNEKAVINDVKSVLRGEDGKIKSIRELEDFLRDAGGFSRQEAKALLANGARGLGLRDADEDQAALEALSKALDNLFTPKA